MRFNKEENMINALQNGPWFIFGHFLSVQRWEPNFVPYYNLGTPATAPPQSFMIKKFYKKWVIQLEGYSRLMLAHQQLYVGVMPKSV